MIAEPTPTRLWWVHAAHDDLLAVRAATGLNAASAVAVGFVEAAAADCFEVVLNEAKEDLEIVRALARESIPWRCGNCGCAVPLRSPPWPWGGRRAGEAWLLACHYLAFDDNEIVSQWCPSCTPGAGGGILDDFADRMASALKPSFMEN